MIPQVIYGSDPAELMSYLVSEGRANEHERPRLVAGSDGLMSWHGDTELSHEDALSIGGEIEQPHRVFGTDIKGGHVRHIPLSLPKSDGTLTDEKWGQVAHDFMRKMGYIDQPGKSDVRWAAVHHGPSGKTGNDHIHLVVNLVREDGTKADYWRDKSRSQKVCRELEQEHKLFKVSGVGSARGYTPGELEAAKNRGRVEPERDTLERIVRSCSVSSQSEDEFVRRLRGEGVLVRASYKKDGEVRGYSVALKPPVNEDPIRYGGSILARDLGLGVLRQRWPVDEETRGAATAEWNAATRHLRVVGSGPEQDDPTFSAGELSQELASWKEKLLALDPDDREAWRAAAGDMAGVFAAWSRATEREPGPLADVAKELGRSAQVARSEYRPARHDHGPSMRASVMLTYLAAQDDPRSVLAVFQRLKELAATIRDHQKSNEDLVRVQGLNRMARERLIGLNTRLSVQAGMNVTEESARPAPGRSEQQAMPNKLARHTTAERTDAPAQKGK